MADFFRIIGVTGQDQESSEYNCSPKDVVSLGIFKMLWLLINYQLAPSSCVKLVF